MRFTLRGVLLGGSIGILLTTSLLWAQCRPTIKKPIPPNPGQQSRQPLMTNHNAVTPDEDDLYGDETLGEETAKVKNSPEGGGDTKNLACVINNRSTIGCRRNEDEVYIPFSFIHSYFEVSLSMIRCPLTPCSPLVEICVFELILYLLPHKGKKQFMEKKLGHSTRL